MTAQRVYGLRFSVEVLLTPDGAGAPMWVPAWIITGPDKFARSAAFAMARTAMLSGAWSSAVRVVGLPPNPQPGEEPRALFVAEPAPR